MNIKKFLKKTIEKPEKRRDYTFMLFAVLAFMFLGALDFVNRFYFCVYFAFAVFLLTPGRKVRVNVSFFALLLLAFAMIFFTPTVQDTILDMIKPFTFPICYLIGCSLFDLYDYQQYQHPMENQEKNVRLAIYVIVGGTFAHFLLNMSKNMNVLNRDVIDFWTNGAMSATGQAALACMAVALSAAFLFSTTGKWKKIAGSSILVLVVAYNLVLAGRTLFVLILIAIAAALFLQTVVAKKNNTKVIAIVFLVVAVLALAYYADLFHIRTSFEQSNFYDRFFGVNNQELDDDSRLEHKLDYLRHMLRYPFGGSHIRQLLNFSAHDLYLDTYDESSIFALIGVVVYILDSLKRLYRVMKSYHIRFHTKQILFCIYLVVNIQFWMEPIMRGMPWLLASYCFIDGTVTQLLNQSNLADTVFKLKEQRDMG